MNSVFKIYKYTFNPFISFHISPKSYSTKKNHFHSLKKMLNPSFVLVIGFLSAAFYNLLVGEFSPEENVFIFILMFYAFILLVIAMLIPAP